MKYSISARDHRTIRITLDYAAVKPLNNGIPRGAWGDKAKIRYSDCIYKVSSVKDSNCNRFYRHSTDL